MFEKVKAAQLRIQNYAHRTPVLTSRTLNEFARAEVLLKCENFQRAGAFKFRGAFNAISQLSEDERARGVLTYSSGNHAQAVALACRILGAQAHVVMPDNAPATKRAATEGYGAHVIPYNPATGDRRQIAEALAAEHGYVIVPPYDDINVVAGQGTAALELFEDAQTLDYLLVPCGGGGLLSGSAIAAKGMCSSCQVIGIEPEVADDATRSFHTKTLHTVHNPPTIADGTRTPSLGTVTFPLVLDYVDDMRTVSEAAIIDAVRFLFFRVKIVVEPSGALGVAALLSGTLPSDTLPSDTLPSDTLPSDTLPVKGRVGVILSGGNVDSATMALILRD